MSELKLFLFFINLIKIFSTAESFQNLFECPEGYSGSNCDQCGLFDESDSNSYPFLTHITFIYNNNIKINGYDHTISKTLKCGGSLIDRDKLVTVAHCILTEFEYVIENKTHTININSLSISSHYVELGFSLRQNSKIKYPTLRVYIKEIITHENFNKTTRENDIALIILEKQVDLNIFTTIACLPNLKTADYPSINESVYLFNSYNLFRLNENVDDELRVVNRSECINLNLSLSSEICAAHPKEFYSDNYGSPLYLKKIINNKTRFVLIGFSVSDQNDVISSSNLNQRFILLSFYLGWIQKSINNTSASKNYLVLTTNERSIVIYDLNKGLENQTKKIDMDEELFNPILINQYLIGSTNVFSGDIKVWDLSKYDLTCSLNNTNNFNQMVIINEKYFATSTYDQIYIWNFIECSLNKSIKLTNTVEIIKIINDVYLVSYSSDLQITIFETKSFNIINNFSSPIAVIYLYYSDAYLILVGARTFSLYNLNDFSLNLTVSYNEASIAKTIIYNEIILAQTLSDIAIYDLKNGSLLYKFDPKNGGHRNQIADMFFFENHKLVATAGADHLIKIWDLNRMQLKYTFDSSNGAIIEAIGNNYLLSYGNDNLIKLWDIKNGLLIYNLNSVVNNILAHIEDKNFVFSYSALSTTQIQSTTPIMRPTKTIPKNISYNLVTLSYSNNQIKVWTLNDMSVNFTLNSDSFDWTEAVVHQLVIENKYLCTAHQNEMIRLWSLQNKNLIATIDNETSGFKSGVNSFEYLGNGLLAASRVKNREGGGYGSNSYSIKIFDLFNNKNKYEFNSSSRNFFGNPSFTHIGNGYLWIKEDSLVWDTQNKSYKSLFMKSGEFLKNNFFVINQTHFASTVNKGEVSIYFRIYSFKNMSYFEKEFYLYESNANGGVYVIDDNHVVMTYGNKDFRISVLNLQTGERECLFDSNSHMNAILTIASLGNGRFASGGADAFIKVWDINTCSLVHTFDNLEDDLYNNQIDRLISIDGFYLASFPRSSAIKIWDLNKLEIYYRFKNSYIDLAYYKIF